MFIYSSLAQFRTLFGDVKKWNRTIEAIETAPSLDSSVMYSIGDSLTYLRAPGSQLAKENLVGHRRYLACFYASTSPIEIEVAKKGDLTISAAYSDLSDREEFAGRGEPVKLELGNLLVLEMDEAWRLSPATRAEVLYIRVTVEGASFHNK